MQDIIEKYEPVRARLAKKNLIALLCMIGCILLTILFFALAAALSIPYLAIGGALTAIGMIVSIIICSVCNKQWKTLFEKEIMTKFVEKAYPGSKFSPDKGYTQDEFMKPNFFQKPDRYTCDNLLEATYGQVNFAMMDYKLEKRTTDKDGHVQYNTYAKGRYFDISFPREFKGQVRVIEKSGIFDFVFTNLKKVELESVDFNKKFKTHATDDLTAFYILTPQVQEKMLELEASFRGRIYYAFEGKHLYIAVNDNNTSFHMPLMSKLTEENIMLVMKDLSIPKGFIDSLKLNREKYQETRNSAV